MHIAVLVPGHGVASTVVAPLEVFRNTGLIWNALHGEEGVPLFRVVTASEGGEAVAYDDNVVIEPDLAAEDIAASDLVFMPTIGLDIDAVVAQKPSMLRLIRRQARSGGLVAGVCTGVAMLAEAGVLDGRPGTTHWAVAEQFRERYPDVDWQPQRFITESDNILCGGGVYAAVDLCLHLVERLAGYEAARQCGRAMLIDPPRTWQASFSEPVLKRQHQDEKIRKAQDYLAHAFREGITVEDMASRVNMSPRNFSRRFRAATGEPPLAYLHKLRIDCAKHLLEAEYKSVQEICVEVGYEDQPHFRNLFKRHTGLTPSEYRERFGKRGPPAELGVPAV